ncbi:hypothetical protein CK203_024939 [Vitis vinifera]|uniref:Uncharacterized protein n=1 Tax=Vitis vinifera TaxID=29760 RepID=A0A438J725_VITVI|nr:hypothetical protein CK203_024939 [Vitis vinifera]
MDLPPSFKEKLGKEKVYRLKKSLYGLKQSPRSWFEIFGKEALFLQDLRLLKIKEGYIVELRRWSSKENSKVEGKFRGSWIELWGLHFHFWSEVHLKKIVEQWGTVTEIDWRTLKLFDLSKARVRISMKKQLVLPALIEVIDGGCVFTISIAVVGVEEVRRGREMGESTQEIFCNSLGDRWWKTGPFSKLGQETGGKKPFIKNGSLRSEDVFAMGKGKFVSEVSDVQPRGSAMNEVKFGSKKLWTTLFPPSLIADKGFEAVASL